MSDLTILPEQGITTHHSGAHAAATHAVAQIQARAVIALKRPRDMDVARAKILKDCQRPGFARAARYDIPNRGTGMTIRFAESIIRNWPNLYIESIVVDDNSDSMTIRVSVTDLESNSCLTRDVPVEKTVERHREPRNGAGVVGTRFNTKGEELFILRATSEDCLGKINSAVSKALRTLLLKFVPHDVIEDCEYEIEKTNQNEDAQDPDAAKKRLVEGFSKLNVTPADLAEYLGKSLARLQPVDLKELGGIWSALGNGETTWEEVMDEKHPTQVAEGVTNAMDAEAAQSEEHNPHGQPLGDLASELDKADAKPKKPKPEEDSRTRGDILTDIESLGLSEAQITSAASDMTGEMVLDYMKLTDTQLADLFNRLQEDN